MDMNISQENSPSIERRKRKARARRLAKRVEILADEGRVEEAIACQAEVTDLRPDDPSAFLRLGFLYREARRIDPAVSAFRRASCLNPDKRDPREALMETLLEAGRFQETINEGRAWIKVAPRSLFARDLISVAYLQLGQIDKALQMTGEMVWLDPLNPGHHFKRALLFQQQGNIKAAVTEFSRAVDMAIPESEVHEHATDSLATLDDYQMRQIVLLASEDRLFQLKLRRNAEEAAEERGFCLSEDGVARLRHLAENHLSDMTSEISPSATWGGVNAYN